MRDFTPWQPFSRCWEPDEGMLAEIERDGMVAWARREAFEADVRFWAASDREMLKELETSDRARMYGYGPTRPLYLPENLRIDGKVWATTVLPKLAEQAASLVNDPVALRSFEQRIGRDAEAICRSFDGQTAHQVAHELNRKTHPLNGALFRVVANDVALWLQQDGPEAPETPLTAFLDRGVMRTIAKRMKLIRAGLLLIDEVPIPKPLEHPLFDEGPMERVVRIVLWGKNGLGYLLRNSMVDFYRERIFDLGSRWLFSCYEADASRVGLGHLILDAFWQIVEVFDFCGFEPERADLWKLSFRAQLEPLHPFSLNRVDIGLIESWIFQHRYRLTSLNWGSYDPVLLYGQLGYEIGVNHGDQALKDGGLTLRAKEADWETGLWKQWGMQHENPVIFDHAQRYICHEEVEWFWERVEKDEEKGSSDSKHERQEEELAYRRRENEDLMLQEENESLLEEALSQDKIEWINPVLYGLMERLHQAYGGPEDMGCDHLHLCSEGWRERINKGLDASVPKWSEQSTLLELLHSGKGFIHQGYAKDLKATLLKKKESMGEAFFPAVLKAQELVEILDKRPKKHPV